MENFGMGSCSLGLRGVADSEEAARPWITTTNLVALGLTPDS